MTDLSAPAQRRWRLRSLRSRLLTGVVALSAVALVLLGAALYLQQRQFGLDVQLVGLDTQFELVARHAGQVGVERDAGGVLDPLHEVPTQPSGRGGRERRDDDLVGLVQHRLIMTGQPVTVEKDPGIWCLSGQVVRHQARARYYRHQIGLQPPDPAAVGVAINTSEPSTLIANVITPPPGPGSTEVTIRVTDAGGAYVDGTLTITVNFPPTLTAPGDPEQLRVCANCYTRERMPNRYTLPAAEVAALPF